MGRYAGIKFATQLPVMTDRAGVESGGRFFGQATISTDLELPAEQVADGTRSWSTLIVSAANRALTLGVTSGSILMSEAVAAAEAIKPRIAQDFARHPSAPPNARLEIEMLQIDFPDAEQRPAAAPELAVGGPVLVRWSDGNEYPGVLADVRPDQCLVRFENGDQRWCAREFLRSAP